MIQEYNAQLPVEEFRSSSVYSQDVLSATFLHQKVV